MKAEYLLIPFALGLGLALVWVLGVRGGAAVAAPHAEGCIEVPNAPAAELHVCPSGCAYSSIQDAVDAADDGDVIKVATGVYTGVQGRPAPAGYVGYDGPSVITQVMYISKTVTIRGGYTTANGFADPPNPDTNLTTLDAQRKGRVLFITGNISPQVEGLRITNGDALGLGGVTMWGFTFDAGGGVYVFSATATISNSRVFSNTAYWGGGLCLYSSVATLSNNTVSSNTAYYGGGLYSQSSPATLSGNTVISNTAHGGGGLLLEWGSDAILTNNVVADNRGNTAGSGLYITDSSPRLLHTTIARNGGGDGSGVYVTNNISNSTVALTNTILVSHTVGITVTTGNTVTLEGTLWGSGAWANTTDWGGNGTVITGTQAYNHWGDPAFVAPDAGDYHIGPASAAIDRGVDAGVYDDIDGNSRPFDGDDDGVDEFDIGADEAYPALEVAKQAAPDPVQPGEQLTYTIYVTNTGVGDLHATITDTLPFSVTLVATSGGALILPGGMVGITWTAFITAPDDVWVETVVVTVDEGQEGPLTNLVEVTTEEGATGKAVVIVNAHKIYLPLVLRNFS